jgi:hypothetical protein
MGRIEVATGAAFAPSDHLFLKLPSAEALMMMAFFEILPSEWAIAARCDGSIGDPRIPTL